MPRKNVNKSQAIRDALKANPHKSPSEIAEALQAKGLNVNAQYVSTVKSSSKAKRKKRKVMKQRKTSRTSKNGLGPIGAALDFIREAGGLELAKQALSTLEEVRKAIR